jgi:hypothetical protein
MSEGQEGAGFQPGRVARDKTAPYGRHPRRTLLIAAFFGGPSPAPSEGEARLEAPFLLAL